MTSKRAAGSLIMSSLSPNSITQYNPPSWTKGILQNVPQHGRLNLANLPTPIHQVVSSSSSTNEKSILSKFQNLNINLYLKRDDMTGGIELGGNKIRKLEFLLADALHQKANAIVTIGGEQSNHCRATAAACRLVGGDGMVPHLILRSSRANRVEQSGGGRGREFGLTGNLLFDRMVGSCIYTCTPGEYGRIGSNALIERLCTYLSTEQNSNPYPIPVGGSNALGTWGYIEGVDELMKQTIDYNLNLDHVVLATGSGGTAAGITLGMALAYGAVASSSSSSKADEAANKKAPKIHAVGVCDNPDYFYKTTSQIAEEMGLVLPPPPPSTTTATSLSTIEEFIRHHLTVHQGKGLGYAKSTSEEIDFCTEFAMETGIVLDPVYSGKALYHFVNVVLEENKESFRGSNVLFWHTGGTLGMYDKTESLLDCMDNNKVSPVKRLNVYKKKEDLSAGEKDDLVTI